MQFYVLLTSATLAILALAWLIWRRTRNAAFPVGIAVLYFWTLHGAWTVIGDSLAGRTGGKYEYLYGKLFQVDLDGDYLKALALYAMFLLAVETTVWIRCRRAPIADPDADPLLPFSHTRLLVLAAGSALLATWIVRRELVASIALNVSGYSITRHEDVPLYTLHQLLLRCAVVAQALGVSSWASGERGRWFSARRPPLLLPAYVALSAGVFVLALMLGDKNELFFGLILGVLTYLANARTPHPMRVACAGLVLLGGVALVDYARGHSLPALLRQGNLQWDELAQSLQSTAASNEAFAAHFSMYGVLHLDVPLTWGSSVVSLAASVVPSFLWHDRPGLVYAHYAQSVGASEGQGYTIHHATGWYLNFGATGVLLGAVLLGWVWAAAYNRSLRLRSLRSRAALACSVLLLPAITAGLPNLIRNGPEGYKGLLLDSVLVPGLVVLVSARWRGGSSPPGGFAGMADAAIADRPQD